jgi:hypothetical protein
MTDEHTPDPTELDEIASASLDDEATEADRARAGADEQVAQRVAEFRGIADQVSAVEPLADDRRESLIATALAAAGGDTAANVTTPQAVEPVAIRSRRRRSVDVRVIAAVAAVVIAVLAIPALLIGMNADSGLHDVAASTSNDRGALDESSPSADAGQAPDIGSTTTTGPSTAEPTTVSLDAADTPDEVGVAVQQVLAADSPTTTDNPPTTTTIESPSTTTTTGTGPPVTPKSFNTTCELVLRGSRPELGAVVLSGTVEYQGVPRQVYAFRANGAGPVTVIVVESDTCTTVTQTTVTPN